MTPFQILILAVIQGAAELLPVSSSAHVIVAEKLMGLDPTRPEHTLMLVLLHTGTMFAVIAYFWRTWRATFFRSGAEFKAFLRLLVPATVLTGAVGMGLKQVIEQVVLKETPHAEIEQIFGNLTLISASLAVVGGLIILSGLRGRRAQDGERPVDLAGACWMGAIQGLCLPLRGFSRSGSTISVGLLRGLSRERVEAFSFALAVVLTPAIIVREVLRLVRFQGPAPAGDLFALVLPSLAGMALAFCSGLLALRWLSAWLEKGRWYVFGTYCICASLVAFVLSWSGL